MTRRLLKTMWRELVDDPEAVCRLSLGNLGALWLLLLLELWLRYGGR